MLTGSLEPVSNSATWQDSIELFDATTGAVYDISAATEITLVVRDPASKEAVLEATLSGGDITIDDTNVFSWEFTADEMSDVDPKAYHIGVNLVLAGVTKQIVRASVEVYDGIVVE